jgi:hypothetical protein
VAHDPQTCEKCEEEGGRWQCPEGWEISVVVQ